MATLRFSGAHDLPTFIPTNATRAIPATTNMTPALKIAPIASHPDVIAPTTTIARTARTRRADIEVLIRPGKLCKQEVAELQKLRLAQPPIVATTVQDVRAGACNTQAS